MMKVVAVMNSELYFLIAFGIVITLTLFSKPRLLTWVVLFASFIQVSWLIRYYGAASFLNWIPLLLGLLLGLRLLLDFLIKKIIPLKRHIFVNRITVAMMSLTTIVIYSCVYNGESIILGLFELRYYVHGYIICLALYAYCKDMMSVDKFKKAIIFLAIWQIPFSVGKYILAGGGIEKTLDSVTGTFASYGELNASLLLAMGIVLYDTKKLKIFIKWNPYLLGMLLVVPLLLSQSRTASGFIVLVVIYTVIVPTIRERKTILTVTRLIPLLIVGIGLVLLLYRFFWLGAYDISKQFDPEYASDYFMKDASTVSTQFSGSRQAPMGRVNAVVRAAQFISLNPVNALIGYGSGATAQSNALRSHGSYFHQIGILVGLGGNDLSKTIMEYGFSAFALLLILGKGIHRGLKKLPRESAVSMDRLYNHIVFVLLLLSWYTYTLYGYYMSIVVGAYIALAQVEADRSYMKTKRTNQLGI